MRLFDFRLSTASQTLKLRIEPGHCFISFADYEPGTALSLWRHAATDEADMLQQTGHQ